MKRNFSRAGSWVHRSSPHVRDGDLSDCFRRIRDAETALADARASLTEFCEHEEEHTAIRNKCRSSPYWRSQSKKSNPCPAPERAHTRHRTQPGNPALWKANTHHVFKRSSTSSTIHSEACKERARRASNLSDEGNQEPQMGGNLLQRFTTSSSLNDSQEGSPLSPQRSSSTGVIFSDGLFDPAPILPRRSSKSLDNIVTPMESMPMTTIESGKAMAMEGSTEESQQDESRGILQHAIFDQVVLAQSQFEMEARETFPTGTTPKSAANLVRSEASWSSPATWSHLLPKSTPRILPSPQPAVHGETKLWQAKKDLSWANVGKYHIPVLNPGSLKRLIWLFIGLTFIVYEAWTIPFCLAFQIVPQGFMLFLAHLITVYFVVDVIVTFLTGYVDRSGHLVFSLDRIAWRYARTWLLLDLIAAIPWIWLVPDSMNQKLTRSTKILRFTRLVHVFRLARLLRMMKLKSLTDIFDMFLEANQTVLFAAGVFRVMAWLFAAMHWTACLWYAVGASGKEATWIKELPEPDLTISESYVWSLYFTMTTMTTVGYGDITPTNYSECCFALALLPVSSVLFATLSGALTTLISNINNRNRKITERRLMLTRYLNWRAVPTYLKIRMRQHLLFFWDMKEGYDIYEEELKGCLPPVLKAELCYHLYGYQLNRAPFLEWMKDYPICMKNLSSMVNSIFLERGDHLFREGDANEEVYMFLSGVMWLSLNQHLHEGNEEYSESQGVTESQMEREETETLLTPGRQGKLLQVSLAMSKMAKGRRNREDECSRGLAAPSIFDSTILLEAGLKLHLQRSNEYKAALVVQRWWRKKKEKERQKNGGKLRGLTRGLTHKSQKSNPVGKSRSGKPRGPLLVSQQIQAPAYFGESCLWVPLDMWVDVPPLSYKYTARAVQRAELLHIPRSAVQTVIRQFSPWLAARFNVFRDAVFQGLLNQVAEEGAMTTSTTDGFGALTEADMSDSIQTPVESNDKSSVSKDKPLFQKKRSVSFRDSANGQALVEAGTIEIVDATTCSSELPGTPLTATSFSTPGHLTG